MCPENCAAASAVQFLHVDADAVRQLQPALRGGDIRSGNCHRRNRRTQTARSLHVLGAVRPEQRGRERARSRSPHRSRHPPISCNFRTVAITASFVGSTRYASEMPRLGNVVMLVISVGFQASALHSPLCEDATSHLDVAVSMCSRALVFPSDHATGVSGQEKRPTGGQQVAHRWPSGAGRQWALHN